MYIHERDQHAKHVSMQSKDYLRDSYKCQKRMGATHRGRHVFLLKYVCIYRNFLQQQLNFLYFNPTFQSYISVTKVIINPLMPGGKKKVTHTQAFSCRCV